jgi:hypothetical protein
MACGVTSAGASAPRSPAIPRMAGGQRRGTDRLRTHPRFATGGESSRGWPSRGLAHPTRRLPVGGRLDITAGVAPRRLLAHDNAAAGASPSTAPRSGAAPPARDSRSAHLNRQRDPSTIGQYRVGMAPRVSSPAARAQQPARENASANGSRHVDAKPVIDLQNTYSQLATAWSQHELEARYRHAEPHAKQPHERTSGALSLVASAIPPAATMSVAIHVLHALPPNAPGELTQQLLATASRNTASALRRCHRGLQQDGASHGYRTEEWLPIISDTAIGILQGARVDDDPPTIVRKYSKQSSGCREQSSSCTKTPPRPPSRCARRSLASSLFAYSPT